MRFKNKRKKRLKKTFPCKCGHSKYFHEGPQKGDQWCNGFIDRKYADERYTIRDLCDCERFVPDNLKYLEQRAKEKGKG